MYTCEASETVSFNNLKFFFQGDLVQVNTVPNQIAKEADKLGRKKK